MKSDQRIRHTIYNIYGVCSIFINIYVRFHVHFTSMASHLKRQEPLFPRKLLLTSRKVMPMIGGLRTEAGRLTSLHDRITGRGGNSNRR
ncbi:hypothetical protein CEXT_347901 [Caerostris extrusa]|uniref:Uncharacterized protein n=1 Tax=Caerostris extrusa TaxID=172846 RepID=A0AAV4S2L7_CAEEX|nr:hypothetical protein CEXT_347901 [Caerostris extrusa]